MSKLLDRLTKEQLEELDRMCGEALSDNEKLDALKYDLETKVGRVLSRSWVVKYATEVRDVIRTRLELGLAENDNRRE